MDSLCIRLRSCGLGCRLLDEFFGCLLYADDIVIATKVVRRWGSGCNHKSFSTGQGQGQRSRSSHVTYLGQSRGLKL